MIFEKYFFCGYTLKKPLAGNCVQTDVKTGNLLDVGEFGLDTDSNVLNAKFQRMWESEEVQKVLLAYNDEGNTTTSYSAYLKNNLFITTDENGEPMIGHKEVSFMGKQVTREDVEIAIQRGNLSVEEANKLRDAYGFGQGGNKSENTVQESKNNNSNKLIPSQKGEVVETITFEGDPDVYKMVNGKKVTSKSANVYIVDGDFDDHPEQWINMNDFSDKLHYNEKKDNPNKVDLGKGYSQTNDWTWYGPNSDFKIEKVEIGESAVYGTKIRVNVLDTSGNIKGSVDMVHFTEINKEIYESSTTDVFPKGTFIGKTNKPIGVSTGPHLHIESLDRGSNRNDIYQLMKGETE